MKLRGVFKYIGIIIGVLFILILVIVITKKSPSVDIGGRCTKFINDYKSYYISIKDISGGGFMGAGPDYKVYISAEQKIKLLNKIKDDVNEEMENIIKQNSTILQRYKISDDFKNVYVYYYSESDIYDIEYELEQQTIAPKIELYHELKNGYGTEIGPIVEFISINK